MKIASVAEVKSRFSAFVKASADGPVVVTRNGRPIAVLVGVQDEEEIERLLLAYSPRLREILDLSRKQILEGGGIRHEEFWAEAAPPKERKGRGKPKGKTAKAGDVGAGKEEPVGADQGDAADRGRDRGTSRANGPSRGPGG
jgi:prevent-host-death family protein